MNDEPLDTRLRAPLHTLRAEVCDQAPSFDALWQRASRVRQQSSVSWRWTALAGASLVLLIALGGSFWMRPTQPEAARWQRQLDVAALLFVADAPHLDSPSDYLLTADAEFKP
jgi:hypothetical protein